MSRDEQAGARSTYHARELCPHVVRRGGLERLGAEHVTRHTLRRRVQALIAIHQLHRYSHVKSHHESSAASLLSREESFRVINCIATLT